MKNSLKKRGQKMMRKFSRASVKASEEGREHIKENFLGRISHIRDIKLLIFEWILLVSAVTMLAVAQAFWFAESYSEDTFVQGGNYVEATVGRVNSLNPLFATTSSEKVLSRLMFARLVATDYSGHPGVGLADEIRSDETGKVWTVKLREGLKWSDGKPITNEDVLFTVSLIQNSAVNSIYATNLKSVKVAELEDGRISFTLASAYVDFKVALEFPIVPKHELSDTPAKTLIEDDFSNNPVTSGAFSFNALQTSSDGESVVYLSANDNYYLGRPMLSSFAVHAYNTDDEVIAAVNSGKVTATAELSAAEASKVASGSFARQEVSINAGAFVFFNVRSSSAVSKTAVRTAIREGLNLDEVRAGAPETEAIDYPLLDSQIRLTRYPEVPTYDFSTAKEKLAGLIGDEKELNVATVNSGYLPAVTERLAEQFRALGFEVNVSVYAEGQDFIANVIGKRNYDVLVYEVEMGAEADPLAYYHSSQSGEAGLNLSNYQNSLVDYILVSARATMDEESRAGKYERFLEFYAQDVPSIPLYQANLTYVYNKNVRTFGESLRLVSGLDRFNDVTEWASARGAKDLTP